MSQPSALFASAWPLLFCAPPVQGVEARGQSEMDHPANLLPDATASVGLLDGPAPPESSEFS